MKTRANVCKRIAVKDFGFVIIFAIVLFIFFLFKSNPNLNLNNIQNSLIFSLFYLLFHFSFFPCAFFTPPPPPEICTVGLLQVHVKQYTVLNHPIKYRQKKVFIHSIYIFYGCEEFTLLDKDDCYLPHQKIITNINIIK